MCSITGRILRRVIAYWHALSFSCLQVDSITEQPELPDTSDGLKLVDSAEWYDNVTKPADTVVNMDPPTGGGERGKQARKGSLMRQDAQKDGTSPPITSDQPPPYPVTVVKRRHGPTGDDEDRETKL